MSWTQTNSIWFLRIYILRIYSYNLEYFLFHSFILTGNRKEHIISSKSWYFEQLFIFINTRFFSHTSFLFREPDLLNWLLVSHPLMSYFGDNSPITSSSNSSHQLCGDSLSRGCSLKLILGRWWCEAVKPSPGGARPVLQVHSNNITIMKRMRWRNWEQSSTQLKL